VPLVRHRPLPSLDVLQEQGEEVLSLERARNQDIRELHIGLLNLMPDKALTATERQYMRLVGRCNRIVQFFVYPFTLPEIVRSKTIARHIKEHYFRFDELAHEGLDALIITGANISSTGFSDVPFWDSLKIVLDFAKSKVTSTLCSCLATHGALYHFYGIERKRRAKKTWGVFSHRHANSYHPLVRGTNTRYDAPHSRHHDISVKTMERKGLQVIVTTQNEDAHLAVSPDGFRFVYLQGHPEYDKNSLLKEYKREVIRAILSERDSYPPYPENYFPEQALPILEDYRSRFNDQINDTQALIKQFPEAQLSELVDDTWGDTGKSLFNNWLGLVYQLTSSDRLTPFMQGVDPEDPLGLHPTSSGQTK